MCSSLCLAGRSQCPLSSLSAEFYVNIVVAPFSNSFPNMHSLCVTLFSEQEGYCLNIRNWRTAVEPINIKPSHLSCLHYILACVVLLSSACIMKPIFSHSFVVPSFCSEVAVCV